MNNSATPSTQEREAALFALAIEKPVAERAAFLQAVCGSDNALHERLLALMSAHEQPRNALAAGPAEAPTVKFYEVDSCRSRLRPDG